MRFWPPSKKPPVPDEGYRQFFGQIADLIDVKEPLAFLGLDKSYIRLKREAMRTDFEVIFCHYEETGARKIGMGVLDEIDRIEEILSIWKNESELSNVNRNAAKEPVAVGGEIFNLVRIAKQIHAQTGGAFDITTTPLTKCWGFFEREARMPSQDAIDEARESIGMEFVELNDKDRTIFFQREGIELTPASLGKGLALDYAMMKTRNRGLKTVLLNGGFSSVLASGAPQWRDSWQIDVRNPLDHAKPLAHIRLKDQGFSSSGSELQHFEHEGKIYSHIIDPRTGWPIENGILNVNVIAPNAAEAEALSTAFCVLGVEKTLEYCENEKAIGVLILHRPEDVGEAELITSNINPDCVEVLYSS